MAKATLREIRKLREAFARDPGGVFVQLADAHRRYGDTEEARRVLRAGLLHSPDDASAHAMLGELLSARGRHGEAEQSWRRVLELNPDHPAALRGLGLAARAAGRRDEALDHFRRLLTLQDDVEVQRMMTELSEAAADPATPEAADVPAGRAATTPSEAAPDGQRGQSVAVSTSHGAAAPGAGAEAVALVEVLVRALEHRGAVFGAESSLTRLLAVALGRELELRDEHLNALALAALLSDLGGLAMNGAGDDGQREVAVTLQLLQGVALPAGVHDALAHQHEHWDGTGTPDGLAEDRIPFPARILAVARGCSHLLADGPGRQPMGVAAAVDEMQRQAGSVYDPVVASLLRRVFAQRERHGIGYGWGGHVYVAHPEELRGLGLATRLHSAGYATETAADVAEVRERLRAGAVQALVVGARLAGGDVAALVQEIRGAAHLRAVPVVVIDADSPDLRISLLSAGADVCFAPDVSFTEFKATLDALLRRSELVMGAAPAAPFAGRGFA
jgi:HD-GYP domain-containing protein (c-di-GMP phosphodiesterase class II)